MLFDTSIARLLFIIKLIEQLMTVHSFVPKLS
jgi:hypothetical protein